MYYTAFNILKKKTIFDVVRITRKDKNEWRQIWNSYTMGCPPVREDNPRALASGLSYIQADKRGIYFLYHL